MHVFPKSLSYAVPCFEVVPLKFAEFVFGSRGSKAQSFKDRLLFVDVEISCFLHPGIFGHVKRSGSSEANTPRNRTGYNSKLLANDLVAGGFCFAQIDCVEDLSYAIPLA